MYRTGDHLGNVDKLVLVDILSPIRGTDDEAHGSYARCNHLGGHHLSVFIGKYDVVRVASPDFPQPGGPAVIISVLPVVMDLHYQFLCRLHRHGLRQQHCQEQHQGHDKSCHGAPELLPFHHTTRCHKPASPFFFHFIQVFAAMNAAKCIYVTIFC